jgi:hypothetical protein
MTMAADPAPASSPFDALAPLRLPEDLRLTPEQYPFAEGFGCERVCAANPEAVLAAIRAA